MSGGRIIRIKSLLKEEIRENGQNYARITARIAKENNGCPEGEMSIWYQTDEENGKYLTDDRADAFVVGLLFTAVSTGCDIHSDVSVSDSLLYQLNEYYLPSMDKMLDNGPTHLFAPEIKTKVKCENAVGTGYSAGVDSFYTVCQHTGDRLKDAPYRPALTHLVIINAGVFEGENAHKTFENAVENAWSLAKEMGLKTVGIDSNIQYVLDEHYLSTYSLRLCSAVLALQGLFGTYLLSSGGHAQESFKMVKENNAYGDLLTCQMLSTAKLRFISYGAGVRRIDKIRTLVDFKPCYTRLHPCFVTPVGTKNCGHCKKCRRDSTSLWAMGALNRFSEVYNIPQVERDRDVNIAFLLATSNDPLYAEALEEMKLHGFEIPARSRILAQQFKRSLDNLKEKEE